MPLGEGNTHVKDMIGEPLCVNQDFNCQSKPPPYPAGPDFIAAPTFCPAEQSIKISGPAPTSNSNAHCQAPGFVSAPADSGQSDVFGQMGNMFSELFRRLGSGNDSNRTAKPVSISLKDLPNFDGANSMRLARFFTEFERCQATAGWSDSVMITLMKSSLRGYAQTIVEQNDDEISEFLSYAQFKSFLKRKFLGNSERQSATNQLFKVRQGPKQSADDYYNYLRDVGDVALCNSDAVARNSLLVSAFCQGLKNTEIRRQVERQHPKTMSEALRFAREEELREREISQNSQMFKSDQNSVGQQGGSDQNNSDKSDSQNRGKKYKKGNWGNLQNLQPKIGDKQTPPSFYVDLTRPPPSSQGPNLNVPNGQQPRSDAGFAPGAARNH